MTRGPRAHPTEAEVRSMPGFAGSLPGRTPGARPWNRSPGFNAHARNKPTILVADKSLQLPFDVSPFRVLLYEDTIAGKEKMVERLRNHIKAILSQSVI